MATRERAIDRGSRLVTQAILRVGADVRKARTNAGLSLEAVAAATGVSKAHLSRLERGLLTTMSVSALARTAAAVGLDLSLKTYPVGDAIRDAAQVAVVGRFARQIHPSLRWATEVPLPIPGDPRAWDGLVAGDGWRYGVEVETQPRDAQAFVRRLRLKERDGQVDGVVLVLPDTRSVRSFVRSAAAELEPMFPVRGRIALARLRDGTDPGGGAVIVLRRDVPPGRPTGRSTT